MNKSHVKQIRGEKYLKQIRLLLSAVLVGIGVGLAVSLFRFCIVHLSDAVKTLVLTTGGEPLRYLLLVGVILLFALIVNFAKAGASHRRLRNPPGDGILGGKNAIQMV